MANNLNCLAAIFSTNLAVNVVPAIVIVSFNWMPPVPFLTVKVLVPVTVAGRDIWNPS